MMLREACMWKCPALDDNGERTNMLLIVTLESQITVAWTVGFSLNDMAHAWDLIMDQNHTK